MTKITAKERRNRMGAEGWFVIALIVVAVLFIVGVGVSCVVQDNRTAAQCRAAGYDGVMASYDTYCYRIVDGHRVLTPLVLVPEMK